MFNEAIMFRRLPTYQEKKNVLLKNSFSNEKLLCDIINEESIDGKLFFVVRIGQRVLKLAKESHSLVKA